MYNAYQYIRYLKSEIGKNVVEPAVQQVFIAD